MLKKLLLAAHSMGFKQTGGVRFLLLHEVPKGHISALRALLRSLQGEFRFIAPSEYEQYRAARDTSLIVSFDDGFFSTYRAMTDVLDPLGVKGLLFIATRFIGMPDEDALRFIRGRLERSDIGHMTEDYRPMEWGQTAELVKAGHSIGIHTASHQRLSAANHAQLQEEIIAPADELRQKAGVDTEWFAYPFGGIGDISPQALGVAARRYRYCCSGIRGGNDGGTNPLCILRQHVDLSAPLDVSRKVVMGAYDITYRSRVNRLNRYAEIATIAPVRP